MTDQEFEEGKRLFKEYAGSLGFDLSFQNFDEELAALSTEYNTPKGALILVYDQEKAIGCAGIRRLDDTTAELKRMFIDPAYRGLHLGKALLVQALDAAKELGYLSLRLDTISSMVAAIQLYGSMGFVEISAYRYNPLEGAVYMEKKLL